MTRPMPTTAITIWKDGSWKVWASLDAYYARNDPDWLMELSVEDVLREQKKFIQNYTAPEVLS